MTLPGVYSPYHWHAMTDLPRFISGVSVIWAAAVALVGLTIGLWSAGSSTSTSTVDLAIFALWVVLVPVLALGLRHYTTDENA